ncbi:MAG: NTP/NDP exchange transporter [Myxococcaceae bacterium]|nr:NTP/NDP exchange transporter [Myxococcaceae bacterium]MBH2006828.1 NTP/NDP exchange transporter [Myxococcaceae bacterium]
MLKSLKQFLWPIQSGEHKKFMPMMLMIAFIIFNYTILRNIKDALIVTEAGSETITFLKFWVVVPSAFIFFFVYAKLSTILSKKALFYTIVTPFLIFFALFATVLYPSRHWLHPVESAEWFASVLPAGLQGLAAIYKYWTYSLFYTLAELWGSAVLSFLFWNFANDVTKVSEAKRFYAHFYLLGNVANVLAGYLTKYFSELGKTAASNVDAWQVSLNYLMSTVVGAGVIILLTYTYLNYFVLSDPAQVRAESDGAPKKKSKPKMSMGESFKFLLHSKYLGLIAVLVMAYGVSINLVEVAWKNQMKLQFADKNDYNAFMGSMTMTTGLATVLVILFGSSIIRRFGWKRGALATPWILGITGLFFFACMIFPEFFSPLAMALGVTPLMLGVWFGFAQNVLSKSTKYALFDPTKEMAYIPLDDESKSKGKAAVDVVGARLGKSGGSLLQQIMFAVIGPITVIAPYSAAIMCGIIVVWLVAVYALNKRFTALSGEK